MDDQERARRYAVAKRTRYMHDIGRPPRIDPTEVAAHIRWLQEVHGMTVYDIGEAGNVSKSYATRILNGQKKTRRTVAERVLAIQPKPPTQMVHSAHLDPTASVRRARALMAAGFTGPILADALGFHGHVPNLWRFLEQQTVVPQIRVVEIRDAYEKLQDADPADFGASNRSIGRAKSCARVRGWAPPNCWDPDTIGDPDAIPEWTGACGSDEGYLIHERDNIPVCDACLEATKVLMVDGARIAQARQDRGLTWTELAHLTGIDRTTLRRYETGESSPNAKRLTILAQALHVEPAGLSDWAIPTQQQRNTERPFRPELLRARMTEHGYTQTGLERAAGVSGGSVCHWLAGRNQPRIDLLEKVCQVLDCQPTDFYKLPTM